RRNRYLDVATTSISETSLSTISTELFPRSNSILDTPEKVRFRVLCWEGTRTATRARRPTTTSPIPSDHWVRRPPSVITAKLPAAVAERAGSAAFPELHWVFIDLEPWATREGEQCGIPSGS